jgi:hypothetical protein
MKYVSQRQGFDVNSEGWSVITNNPDEWKMYDAGVHTPAFAHPDVWPPWRGSALIRSSREA